MHTDSLSWECHALALRKLLQAIEGTAAVAAQALHLMVTWPMGASEWHTIGTGEGLGWHRHWLSGKAQKLSSLDVACNGDLADETI